MTALLLTAVLLTGIPAASATQHPIDPCSREGQAAAGAPNFNCHRDDEARAKVWIRHAGFTDPDKAIRVARCETAGTFDPTIQNYGGSSAFGLFQHMRPYWQDRSTRALGTVGDILNGWHSALVAVWLVTVDGWEHWPTCGRL